MKNIFLIEEKLKEMARIIYQGKKGEDLTQRNPLLVRYSQAGGLA